MKFQGGLKEAAKMLAGLSKAAREKVLETIAKKDPQMALNLSKNMYTFEDLKYLTPSMVVDLLKVISPKDLGLALRIASDSLKSTFLTNSPRLLRQEIEEVLMGPPQLASKVEETQDKIMEVVRLKIDRGEIILNKDNSEKMV